MLKKREIYNQNYPPFRKSLGHAEPLSSTVPLKLGGQFEPQASLTSWGENRGNKQKMTKNK